MSTDREREDPNESQDDELRDESDESAESAEAGESTAATDDSSEVDEAGDEQGESRPRNRAERRLVAKREGRGQPAEGRVDRNRAFRSKVQTEAEERALAEEERKFRLPPKTVSGRNSGSEDVPEWARSFVEWMSARRSTMTIAAVVVLAAAGGAVGVTKYQGDRAARAAASLSEAVTAIDGTIRAADAPPDPPGSPPRRGATFADYAARSRAALEAFRRTQQQPGNAAVVPLARLGEATALYDAGRFAEAKPIFESLVGQNLSGHEARALEGLAYCLEATNDLAGALRRFEELGRLHDGAYRDFATYQQARILHRQNQDPRAKELLRALLERINRARPEQGSTTGSSVSAVVHEQAQALLRDIDPSDELARRRAVPDTSAILRMLQQQGGGAH